MTHREAISQLYKHRAYSEVVLDRWHLIGKIPLIFIPDVAHRVGCKPSDLSKFYDRPMINVGE